MKTLLQDVQKFHEKFGEPEPPGKVHALDLERSEFVIVTLKEEIQEFTEALYNEDVHGQVDALMDLIYFAAGGLYHMGVLPAQGAQIWRRIHIANMLKTRALKPEDSKRGSTLDVVKPEGWTPPNFTNLI